MKNFIKHSWLLVTIGALLLLSCTSEEKFSVSKDLCFSSCNDYKGEPVELKLDVYRMEEARAKKRPVILWVHGGGMYIGSKDASWGLVNLLAEDFTRMGYVFVSMDYRLNPEWEATGAFDATIKDAAVDVASAVDWVRGNVREYGGDPARIILMGHSAGAEIISNYYYSNALVDEAEHDKSAIKAVIPISGNRLFYDGDANTGSGNAPCLIIHGDADDINPCADAQTLLAQLGSKGRMAIMQGNGHMWSENPEQKDFLMKNISAFLKELD